MAQVKVTLTRSLIGRPEDQRVKEVTPQIQGMLHKVRHLVKVEEI